MFKEFGNETGAGNVEENKGLNENEKRKPNFDSDNLRLLISLLETKKKSLKDGVIWESCDALIKDLKAVLITGKSDFSKQQLNERLNQFAVGEID